MKKIALAAALAVSATHAFAGGYNAPVVEAEPVVVEEKASSSAGWVVPVLLLVAVGAAVASNN